MYARITNFKFDTAKTDDMLAKLDSIRGQVKAIDGVVDIYSTWRDDGAGMVCAFYQSQAAADAASVTIQGIWGELAEFLTAPPETELYPNVVHMNA